MRRKRADFKGFAEQSIRVRIRMVVNRFGWTRFDKAFKKACKDKLGMILYFLDLCLVLLHNNSYVVKYPKSSYLLHFKRL